MPQLYVKVEGFLDSVRKFVCHVIGITFQSVEKHSLMELLGGLDGMWYLLILKFKMFAFIYYTFKQMLL